MLSVVILAAGMGKRFKSRKHKSLHRIANRSLIDFNIQKAVELGADRIFVVAGYQIDQICRHVEKLGDVVIVEQKEQLGTADALCSCVSHLPKTGRTLVLYGDTPLIDIEDLRLLLESEGVFSILTDSLDDPFGYGRIVRDSRGSFAVVEEMDASPEQREIKEIFTGVMLISNAHLEGWLSEVGNDNAQSQYYLTDIIRIAFGRGYRVEAVRMLHEGLSIGVNTRGDLVKLNKLYRGIVNANLLNEGLGLMDPDSFYLRGDLSFGFDVQIDNNVIVEGKCSFGDDVRIGANCVIVDSVIEDGVEILPFCHIQGAHISRDCVVGPYSRLRPMSELGAKVKVGNFVEVKKSRVDSGSKIPHLSYIGDSIVGSGVNVGAGTITCNYDGAKKSKTVIEDGCFVGSGVMLVAPVKIGSNSLVAAGSVITEDVGPDTLAISRMNQVNRPKRN